MAKKNGFAIMVGLLDLVKSLLPVMILSVVFGVTGALCAVALSVIAVKMILSGSLDQTMVIALGVCALGRGVLHYVEQYCNHYIAFKELALIRHEVFKKLRELAPAKLETQERGSLISTVTADIENLEVFYAHTISPVMIALLVSVILVGYLCLIHPLAGVCAAVGYLIIGVVIPRVYGRRNASLGVKIRHDFAALNAYALESLKGVDETLQYHDGDQRQNGMRRLSRLINYHKADLTINNASLYAMTQFMVMIMSVAMLLLMSVLLSWNFVTESDVLIATVLMMSSCGPCVALANLSGTLTTTIASGRRVLSLLNEKPLMTEVTAGENIAFNGVKVQRVSFRYDDQDVLKDCTVQIPPNKMIGVVGPSGSGKSTLLKLMMRFYDVDQGAITMPDIDIRDINTHSLRLNEAYLTQETYIFHDTIAANIAYGHLDATMGEVIVAAQKAAIHEWIKNLPEGYETVVGEEGYTLSSGEQQRIGLARAFLHEAPLMLLDEPTCHLDVLNEATILKALDQERWQKTIVLVSHRPSTVNHADAIYSLKKL